ncbi:hypothetical protein [Spirillospora albida]|uniref:hypothetical protein n=1 Tax=Spirillospora albida TaxID=58123 RepID=UPI000689C40C|nr:hypothetical protein [Spirillospora albida]
MGAIVGLLADRAKRHRGMQVMLLVPLLVAAEGSVADLPRGAEVTVARTAAAGTDIERALAGAPAIGPVGSRLLRMKFPKPVRADGTGLDVGATRRITFTPRTSLGIGARPEPRTMELRVVRREPGRVVFAVTRDTTLARWLEFEEAEFAWRGARLSVTLRYTRTFDPSWYFGPVQRYAMGEAAAYLADTFTAP